MYDSFFNQKVVVITGSSMGIGKSLALLLGGCNAKIVLNSRNRDRLLITEKELIDRGCEVISLVGDVTLEQDCRSLIERTIQHYGKIDVIVNNAGSSMRGPVEQLIPNVVSSIYAVNTIAPVMLTQMSLPYIKETNGSIVFISSLAGLRGLPFVSVYSAAKMSLTAIAQALRVEHYDDNIHIGLVFVGITKIESGKTAIGADGSTVLLAPRTSSFSTSIEEVARRIAKHIASKEKQTIIGLSGKIYYLIAKYFPALFEFLLIKSREKMKNLYN